MKCLLHTETYTQIHIHKDHQYYYLPVSKMNFFFSSKQQCKERIVCKHNKMFGSHFSCFLWFVYVHECSHYRKFTVATCIIRVWYQTEGNSVLCMRATVVCETNVYEWDVQCVSCVVCVYLWIFVCTTKKNLGVVLNWIELVRTKK